MRLLSAQDIATALPMSAAIAVMSRAFQDIVCASASVAERQALALPTGTGLLMGAAQSGTGLLAKLVSVLPGNPALGLPGTLGTTLLADDSTGQPLALLDGTALTAWRTAALSACAIDRLARADAMHALLIGCGTQAATQVLGLDAVRNLEVIELHATSSAQVERFIATQQPKVRARLQPVRDLDAAVAAAAIVITATSSSTPVFDARHLSAGAHLNAIGSFRAGMCEFDPELCQRSTIFIESLDTARLEAGELIEARRQGWTSERDWTEFGSVLNGRHPGRVDAKQTTLFKSVGHVLFDLHAARAVYDRAVALELGTAWNT